MCVMIKIVLSVLLALSATFATAQTSVMQDDIFAKMDPEDKAVVVAVHYGTTDADVRRETIEKFNARLRNEFPNYEFRQAWTSRTAVKALDAQGEVILTPVQLLDELNVLGYTHVLLQPSMISEGMEMHHLRYEVQAAKRKFKKIRLGEPLLGGIRDYEMAILATAAAYGKEKEGNVLVCYGDKALLDKSFAMMDYVMRDKEMDNWYVTVIGGYPDLKSLKRELKRRKDKKVNLIPFVFLNDENVNKDIYDEMKEELKDAGFKVSVVQHGLGESDEILDRYMEHARFARQYRTLTPTEVKLVESAY